MDKTAIEFYRTELNALVSFRETRFKTEEEIFERAKEMELAQRREDTNHGYAQGYDDGANGKEPARPSLSDHPPLNQDRPAQEVDLIVSTHAPSTVRDSITIGYHGSTNHDRCIVISCSPEGAPNTLEFRENGDIMVHGRPVGQDKEIVEGLREFLNKSLTFIA